MPRLMLSAGMLTALASAMAVLRRGFESGSPPPMRAATAISLISLVKSLPLFASAAPFLCLMVAHFEWPDMCFSSSALPAGAEESSKRPGQRIIEFFFFHLGTFPDLWPYTPGLPADGLRT